MTDRRLLELEDQISYLLKGPKITPKTRSMHVPQAYAKNGKVKKAIFKQREEINDRMAKMFWILKELTTSRTPEKVLVREEASNPITKCVNAISLVKMEKDKSIENNEVIDKNVVESSKLKAVEPIELNDIKKKMEDRTDDESVRSMKEEFTGWETKANVLVGMPRLQPIGYYLKHEINKKIIEGLVDNHKYNDSLLATGLGKMDYETYNSLPVGPMYNAILKKKLAKKDDIEGNFVIPCSIRRLKYVNALIDQGSDVK
ncbi:hypothetical protein Tco_1244642, partial [Tanacetum coccineum]